MVKDGSVHRHIEIRRIFFGECKKMNRVFGSYHNVVCGPDPKFHTPPLYLTRVTYKAYEEVTHRS